MTSPQPKEIVATLARMRCGILRRPEPAPVTRGKGEVRLLAYPSDTPPAIRLSVRGAPTLESILLRVSYETKIDISSILSPSRLPRIARARQLFCWLARHSARRSFPVIGRMCNRDHSTVLHACWKVDTYPELFEPERSRLLEAVKGGDPQ